MWCRLAEQCFRAVQKPTEALLNCVDLVRGGVGGKADVFPEDLPERPYQHWFVVGVREVEVLEVVVDNGFWSLCYALLGRLWVAGQRSPVDNVHVEDLDSQAVGRGEHDFHLCAVQPTGLHADAQPLRGSAFTGVPFGHDGERLPKRTLWMWVRDTVLNHLVVWRQEPPQNLDGGFDA